MDTKLKDQLLMVPPACDDESAATPGVSTLIAKLEETQVELDNLEAQLEGQKERNSALEEVYKDLTATRTWLLAAGTGYMEGINTAALEEVERQLTEVGREASALKIDEIERDVERTVREAKLMSEELERYSAAQDIEIAELQRQVGELTAQAELTIREIERANIEASRQLAVIAELKRDMPQLSAQNEQRTELPVSTQLDMLPPSSRPLAEPRIFEDDEFISRQRTVILEARDLYAETDLLQEYSHWAKYMAVEAEEADDWKRWKFYAELTNDILIDTNIVMTEFIEFANRLPPNADKDEADNQPRQKQIDMIPPGSRPLAEPPIFAYNEILENEDEIKKDLKKKGLWNNTAVRYLLELEAERQVMQEYATWALDMLKESVREDLPTVRFHLGLAMATAEELDTDIEHGKDVARKMWQSQSSFRDASDFENFPWLVAVEERGEAIIVEEENGQQADEDEVWYSANEEEPRSSTNPETGQS